MKYKIKLITTPLRWRLEEDGDGNPVDRSQRTPRCLPLSVISLSLWFDPQKCLLPQPWCPRKWWRRRSGQRPLIQCPKSPYKEEPAAAHGWPHGRHTDREVAWKTGQKTRKSATVNCYSNMLQWTCYSISATVKLLQYSALRIICGWPHAREVAREGFQT